MNRPSRSLPSVLLAASTRSLSPLGGEEKEGVPPGSWSQCVAQTPWGLCMNRREESTGPLDGRRFLALNLDLALNQNAESKSKITSKSKSRITSKLQARSWSQCALRREWRLSMNRPFVLVLVLEWVVCLRGRQRRTPGRVGSWSQCVAQTPWGLSMNRSTPSSRSDEMNVAVGFNPRLPSR